MKNLKFILAFAMLFGAVATVGVAPATNEVTKVEAAEVLTDTCNCPKGTVVNGTITYTTNNGMFTIVNSKGSSTNAVAAYSPWRIYGKGVLEFTAKSSTMSITEIKMTATSADYNKKFTVTAGSIGGATSSYSETNSSATKTITFDEAKNIGYVKLVSKDTKQSRFSKIVISYTNTSVEPSIAIVTPSNTDVIVDGKTVQLTANVTNASDATVNWHSTDTNIVNVNDGIVSAVSEGKASVYASITVGGVTYESNKIEFTSYDFRDSVEVDTSLTMTTANFPTGSYYYGIYKMGDYYYHLNAGYKNTENPAKIQLKNGEGYFYNYKPYSKTIKSIEIVTSTPGFALYGDKSYGKSADAVKITPTSSNGVLTYNLTGDDYNYFYIGEATETLKFDSITLIFESDAASYSAIFDANGGTVNGEETLEVSAFEGEEIALPTPIYDGYKFLGWYDAPEGGNKVETLVSSAEMNGTTLYAQWLKVNKYSITPANFQELNGFETSGLAVNANYGDKEFNVTPGAYITSSNFTDVEQIVTEVYGTYDNISVYAADSATGTKITPTKTSISNGVRYTYELNGADSFYITNTSTYTVYMYNIDILYSGTFEEPATLTSIAATPAKTEYLVGEEFEGATVTATYSDETTADVTAEATFTGYDMNTAGEQTVTVTYEGLTTTFTITVSEPLPTPAEKLAEVETRASVGFAYTKSGDQYSFSNVRISWKATVSAELIAELGEITAAGFECSIEESDEVYPINCTNSIGTDANGNTYIFGSLLIPSEVEAKTLITTKAFFVVDGEKVYLQETTHSFETAVKAYLNGAVPLTEEQKELVKALAAAYNIVA